MFQGLTCQRERISQKGTFHWAAVTEPRWVARVSCRQGMWKSLLGQECWRGVRGGRATLSLDVSAPGRCLPEQCGPERSPSRRELALCSPRAPWGPPVTGGSASVLTCPLLCSRPSSLSPQALPTPTWTDAAVVASWTGSRPLRDERPGPKPSGLLVQL